MRYLPSCYVMLRYVNLRLRFFWRLDQIAAIDNFPLAQLLCEGGGLSATSRDAYFQPDSWVSTSRHLHHPQESKKNFITITCTWKISNSVEITLFIRGHLFSTIGIDFIHDRIFFTGLDLRMLRAHHSLTLTSACGRKKTTHRHANGGWLKSPSAAVEVSLFHSVVAVELHSWLDFISVIHVACHPLFVSSTAAHL